MSSLFSRIPRFPQPSAPSASRRNLPVPPRGPRPLDATPANETLPAVFAERDDLRRQRDDLQRRLQEATWREDAVVQGAIAAVAEAERNRARDVREHDNAHRDAMARLVSEHGKVVRKLERKVAKLRSERQEALRESGRLEDALEAARADAARLAAERDSAMAQAASLAQERASVAASAALNAARSSSRRR